MQRTTTLRRSEELHITGQVIPFNKECKKAPMHFKFDKTLRQQGEKLQNGYQFTDEEVAPTFGFINSRAWTSAELPAGADAWVIAVRAHVLGGDRKNAVAKAACKLRLSSPFPLIDETVDAPFELSRSDRTSRCMALLLQKQPITPLMVMAVQVGLDDRYAGCSLRQAEQRFASNEFSLGDFEFSNVFSNYPGCIEAQSDRGLIVGGDRMSDDYAFGYEVKGRTLHRRLLSVTDHDPHFRIASAFLFA